MASRGATQAATLTVLPVRQVPHGRAEAGDPRRLVGPPRHRQQQALRALLVQVVLEGLPRAAHQLRARRGVGVREGEGGGMST